MSPVLGADCLIFPGGLPGSAIGFFSPPAGEAPIDRHDGARHWACRFRGQEQHSTCNIVRLSKATWWCVMQPCTDPVFLNLSDLDVRETLRKRDPDGTMLRFPGQNAWTQRS